MKRTREVSIKETDLLATNLETGQIEVRTLVLDENGDTVYHRHVLNPGANLGNEDPRVRRLAEKIHTPEVIAAWVEAIRHAND